MPIDKAAATNTPTGVLPVITADHVVVLEDRGRLVGAEPCFGEAKYVRFMKVQDLLKLDMAVGLLADGVDAAAVEGDHFESSDPDGSGASALYFGLAEPRLLCNGR